MKKNLFAEACKDYTDFNKLNSITLNVIEWAEKNNIRWEDDYAFENELSEEQYLEFKLRFL